MLWDGNRQVQEYTDEQVFTTVYEQGSFEPVARIVQLASHIEQKRLADIAYETRRFVRIGESEETINQRIQDKSQPLISIYHYHCNHLGTPQELTNQDGDVIWLSYDRAWGGSFDTIYKQQFIDNFALNEFELQPIKFQGQSLDVETGLHYNRFRYYDSDVGMFISRDPIGLLGGSNVFQYAPNPIGWIDPWGLKCKDPNGYKTHDTDNHGNLSPQKNRAKGHGNNADDNFIQSHHPIQDEWAQRNISGYRRNRAPGILLPSSSGMSHAQISALQRTRRAQPNGWNTSLRHEFNEGYREMINSGVSPKNAKKAYKKAYKYFDGLRGQNANNPLFDI
jgi:RHS repeat-associated protein